MKEISKLLLSATLAAGLLFTTACATTDGDKPTPTPSGGDKTTIIDAYDKGGRPNYDDMFDYNSGYKPQEPATEAVVTIAESSSIKFKDGSKRMTLAVGKLLTQDDFDATTLNGKKIGGVAVIAKTEDEEPKEYISSFVDLNDFVPTTAVTVSPYFAVDKGESVLWGSNNKDYATNLVEDTFVEEKAIVNGYMGLKVDYGAAITSGASIRYKATMKIETGERYTFRYTFVNYGAEELKFNLYQMKSGRNYDDPETAIASEAITLKAGETSSVIELTIDSEKNDVNSLTGLRFNSDMTSASFGVIMSVENTTEKLPAKITLDLPQGFTVKDYQTDVLTNTKLTLPTANQIENNTVHNLLYWVDGKGNKVTSGMKITGDMTIKPVLSETVTITFDLPEKFTFTGDYKTEVQVETETKFTLPTADRIKNDTGRKFIRWADVDGNAVTNGFTVKNDLTIVPELSSPAKITVSLPAGLTLSGDYVTDIQTGDVIVAPTAEQISGTIAEGRQIAGWYVVGGKNAPITENTIAETEKVTIAPYFTRAEGTVTLQGFGDATDGQPLVFSNVQSALVPMNGYDGIDPANFDKISAKYKNDTVIGGGANGYAELGNVLSYNGTMPAGSAFRCGTIITNPTGGAAIVKKNIEHTFIYNFQNFGASKISLTIQGVNNGANVEGPVNEIILQPGESTTIRFSVTYTSGSDNKNVMGYFAVKEELTNMKLGVSVNVILGKKTISVKTAVDDDITLSSDYLARIYKEGDKLVLPTASDYTDNLLDEREIIGWKNAATGATIDGEVTLTSDIEIAPIFRYLKAQRITLTLKETAGFTLSEDYLNIIRRIGDTLVLPTDADYADTLSDSRKLIGWKNAATGEEIPAGYVLEGDLEIAPIFETYVKVAVTLGEGVTFKTGEKTLELNVGSALPEITAPAGFKGFYVDGNVVAAADYEVPNEAVTLYPVYDALADYSYISVGSGANYGYNNDLTPGNKMYEHEGFAYTGAKSSGGTAQLVKGGDYYVYGSYFKDTTKNYAGTAIRIDSKHPTALTKDTVTEFKYVVENKGATELALSIYQISGSSEYKAAGGYYGYESRYRIDVRLQPGESASYTAQYLLGKNGNALTYIVFEKDMDNFSFGIAISEKVLADKTAVDEKYTNQEALVNPAALTFEAGETGITVNSEYLNKFRAGKFITAPTASDYEANGATIEKWQITFDGKNYDLPTAISDYTSLRMPSAGAVLTAVVAKEVTVTYETPATVTYEGGKTSYKTGETLSLPTLSGTDASNRTAIGWYNKATREVVTNETVINDDLTLTPYYAHAGTTELTPLSGANSNDNYGPDSLSDGLTKTFVKQTDVIVGGEKGITLGYTALKAGEAFRFKTAYSIAVKSYKFSYVIENLGLEELNLTVYQLTGGTATTGMPSKEVKLAAGETISFDLTLSFTKSNTNILTYFVMGGDISALNMGVAMSISEA